MATAKEVWPVNRRKKGSLDTDIAIACTSQNLDNEKCCVQSYKNMHMYYANFMP